METQGEAGPEARLTELGGLFVPALGELTISGNLPSNNINAHGESRGAHMFGRSSVAFFSAVDQRSRRGR